MSVFVLLVVGAVVYAVELRRRHVTDKIWPSVDFHCAIGFHDTFQAPGTVTSLSLIEGSRGAVFVKMVKSTQIARLDGENGVLWLFCSG